jgi:hypothetical protein
VVFCREVRYINNCEQKVLGRTNRLLSFETAGTIQKKTRPTILILLGVYLLPRYGDTQSDT